MKSKYSNSKVNQINSSLKIYGEENTNNSKINIDEIKLFQFNTIINYRTVFLNTKLKKFLNEEYLIVT